MTEKGSVIQPFFSPTLPNERSEAAARIEPGAQVRKRALGTLEEHEAKARKDAVDGRAQCVVLGVRFNKRHLRRFPGGQLPRQAQHACRDVNPRDLSRTQGCLRATDLSGRQGHPARTTADIDQAATRLKFRPLKQGFRVGLHEGVKLGMSAHPGLRHLVPVIAL